MRGVLFCFYSRPVYANKDYKCGWTAKGNETYKPQPVGSYILWNVSENWK